MHRACMPPIAFGRAAPFGCCQPREADKEGQGAGTVSTEATEAAGEDGGEHAEAEGDQRPQGAEGGGVSNCLPHFSLCR